jgi:hypothetical protein
LPSGSVESVQGYRHDGRSLSTGSSRCTRVVPIRQTVCHTVRAQHCGYNAFSAHPSPESGEVGSCASAAENRKKGAGP